MTNVEAQQLPMALPEPPALGINTGQLELWQESYDNDFDASLIGDFSAKGDNSSPLIKERVLFVYDTHIPEHADIMSPITLYPVTDVKFNPMRLIPYQSNDTAGVRLKTIKPPYRPRSINPRAPDIDEIQQLRVHSGDGVRTFHDWTLKPFEKEVAGAIPYHFDITPDGGYQIKSKVFLKGYDGKYGDYIWGDTGHETVGFSVVKTTEQGDIDAELLRSKASRQREQEAFEEMKADPNQQAVLRLILGDLDAKIEEDTQRRLQVVRDSLTLLQGGKPEEVPNSQTQFGAVAGD